MERDAERLRIAAARTVQQGTAVKVGELVTVNKPFGATEFPGDRIYPYIGKIVKEVNSGKWGVVRLVDVKHYAEAPAHASREGGISIPGRDVYVHMEFKSWCQKGVHL